MQKQKIGILHPGAMGISVAASASHNGHDVYWVSAGRSTETHERATSHHLFDAGSLEALCATCDMIISVCPPHAAEDVAGQVAERGFSGLYLDANAISPPRTGRIGDIITGAGAAYVDGGIVGGPAWQPGTTWLYLSGERAPEVAACFADGPLETAVIGHTIGKASALKMCFAAYTKGTTALLCAIMATAETLGVRADLETQWGRGGSDFAVQTQQRVQRVTAKAWRFEVEMHEIASTFAAAGLPDGFHEAAAVIYGRLAHFKEAPEHPALEAVLAALVM